MSPILLKLQKACPLKQINKNKLIIYYAYYNKNILFLQETLSEKIRKSQFVIIVSYNGITKVII